MSTSYTSYACSASSSNNLSTDLSQLKEKKIEKRREKTNKEKKIRTVILSFVTIKKGTCLEAVCAGACMHAWTCTTACLKLCAFFSASDPKNEDDDVLWYLESVDLFAQKLSIEESANGRPPNAISIVVGRDVIYCTALHCVCFIC